ncbi:hypothetical protein J6500_01025 [Bradyrhizobium sp. WSM 1704]|uniref:hypothetical protein n=1 Tax=Bradyrhizobium semiaridum TaxID=2821404 RepID=UPI001CE301BD|nr:hypothetical protein [Bradyrhizobium semiaridum]MCA6120489.1 hypothetical protein [Bradyrhizobium semiaridum]
MPLHRDIHWLGRQWAVTGHGLQLINQKQMGYYDIEVARLWEPGVIEAMQSKAWINRPDFDKAVEIARARFAGPGQVGAPPLAAAATLSQPPDVQPPAQPSPVRPPSGPSLEELLAKLKSRSTGPAAAPAAPAGEPPLAAAAKPAPLKPEAPKSELAKSELPKFEPPKAELPRLKPVNSEPLQPDASKSELPRLKAVKSESLQSPPPRPESLAPESPKPEPAKPEPRAAVLAEPVAIQPVAPTPVVQRIRSARQAAVGGPKPEWPVFERKIAGSARFVRPWRARLTSWKGTLPGLPPPP